MEERWAFMGAVKITATLETRPALGELLGSEVYSDVMKDALTATFGERVAVIPVGTPNPRGARGPILRPDTKTAAAYVAGKAGIECTAIFAGEERVADLWMIAASGEDEAKALVAALLGSCRDAMRRGLEKGRQEISEFTAKIEEARPEMEEYTTQIQQAEDECRQLGVADLTDEAVDSAIARFEQERRLNQVDIAGLEASVASAKQRTGGDGNLAQTLARIQVELDIQLVGKLARKDALVREVRDLQAGRAARTRVKDVQNKLNRLKAGLFFPKQNLTSREHWVQELENLPAHFTVTDDRVTLSAIAQTP